MNIGILCYPTYGGSGVVATELGKYLADEGHTVHFISYDIPFRLNRFTKNIFYHEVIVGNYPLFEYKPYESALVSKIVDVGIHEKLDIIHAHYAIPHASAAIFAQNIIENECGKKIPVVTTLHGTDITLIGKSRNFLPIIKYSIEKSQRVTAVSEYLKNESIHVFDIQKEIHVVHNFVNHNIFKRKQTDAPTKNLFREENESVILHISNFRKVKRTEDVVKVFIEVRKKMKAKLVMVGDGPYRSRCEELCRKAHICDDIKFLGKQESLVDIIHASNILLFPSELESFGLAPLECMACGVPVIGTKSGGIQEVIEDGGNGFLCEIGDIQSMKEKVLFLLNNKAEKKKMEEAAYRRSLDFSVHEKVPAYVKLYTEAINGK